ncbi:Transcriptional activator DEMETER [Ananas comosus]|uniref:Transcriptional activator DEMETER n=1 Tax=Ananas comosus TaxID=4615 RepID=A0A199VQI9_ANACO|nr:Transcriptional activator DEMETER [Ananas comosus]
MVRGGNPNSGIGEGSPPMGEHFPFLICEGETPFSFLPHFNSVQEKAVSKVMSGNLPFLPTPMPFERNISLQDRLPPEVIDLVDDEEDERAAQEDVAGKWQPLMQNNIDLGLLNNVVLSQMQSSQQPVEDHIDLDLLNNAMLSQMGSLEQTVQKDMDTGLLNNVVLSQMGFNEQPQSSMNKNIYSEDVSTQQVVINDAGKGENQGIDLNKTPQQAPRRKKHRPKVIKEGKPKTPKTVTPKLPKNKEENPSGKRKYVRKKKEPSNPSVDPPASGELRDPRGVPGDKPVRRRLNFDNEVTPASNEKITSSEKVGQDREVFCVAASTGSNGVVADNLPNGREFDLNNSINQMPNESVTSHGSYHPTCSMEATRINHMLNEYRWVHMGNPVTPPQYPRREVPKENLNELLRIPRETGLNHLDSYGMLNLQMKGTKREHNLVGGTQVSSSSVNIGQAYSDRGVVNSHPDTSGQDPYLPDSHKKKRMENDHNSQNGFLPNAYSPPPPVAGSPFSNWKANQVLLCNSDGINCDSAHRLMTLQIKRGLDHTGSGMHNRSNMPPTPGHNHTHTSVAREYTHIVRAQYATNIPNYGHKQTPANVTRDYNHISTPEHAMEMPHPGHNQTPTSAARVYSHIATPEYAVNTPICGHNQTPVSANKGSDHLATPQKRFDYINNRLHSPITPFRRNNDSQSEVYQQPQATPETISGKASESSKRKGRPKRGKVSPTNPSSSKTGHEGSGKYENIISSSYDPKDPLDVIIHRLRCLDINRVTENDCVAAQEQMALVPYEGGQGTIVPYNFELVKKRRSRAKVDLDAETNRVWRLLMLKEGSEAEGVDKEKWWEEERRIFRGRVDSFIARMHLVQGDRRFSQWKGSVVDSVVGVFLTQNVSDHLSSSAFMALAAKYPVKSQNDIEKPRTEMTTTTHLEQPGSRCIVSFDDDPPKWQESIVIKEVEEKNSLVIIEEKEGGNCNESLGSNTGDSTVEYSKGKGCANIGHESPDSSTSDKSAEDVVSSQNSVVSSQNSVNSNELNNFGVQELMFRRVSNGTDSSTPFMDLLRVAEMRNQNGERIPTSESHGGVDLSPQNGIENNSLILDQLNNDNLSIVSPSVNTYSYSYLQNKQQHDSINASYFPHLQTIFNSKLAGTNGADASTLLLQAKNRCGINGVNAKSVLLPGENRFYPPSPAPGIPVKNKTQMLETLGNHSVYKQDNFDYQTRVSSDSQAVPKSDLDLPIRSKQHMQPLNSSEAETCTANHLCCNNSNNDNNLSKDKFDAQLGEHMVQKFQRSENKEQSQIGYTQNAGKFQVPMKNYGNQLSSSNIDNTSTPHGLEGLESKSKDKTNSAQKFAPEKDNDGLKPKKATKSEKKKSYDWDNLRKETLKNAAKRERTQNTMDSLDWEAVRSANVKEISDVIRERGMNNLLAERIKDFLDRLVRDHGSVDLEWLRDVDPDKAKDYLLSVRGLGLKSVECVRLLTLHHLAFPVDTNVGRICVRLGWVPLQPLPESLQLHLLELYPILETIQKYLWPRLCKLDQRTLYELHYQMITFGKVFCTKSKPNCNACPMRAECKHFASAFASARLALPGPEEKSIISSTVPITSENFTPNILNLTPPFPQLEGSTLSQEPTTITAVKNNEPIIEEPATPENICPEIEESAIEEAFLEDPDEIPTIKLNFEEFTQNLQNYMQANNMELQEADMSKALVALTPEAASIPMPKLKNISRLRTEHQVYELPDSHPLLQGVKPHNQ